MEANKNDEYLINNTEEGKNDLIVLLTKFPTKGISKTRLYDSIGIENAYLLAIAMLSDLLLSLKKEIGKKVLYIPKQSLLNGRNFCDTLNTNYIDNKDCNSNGDNDDANRTDIDSNDKNGIDNVHDNSINDTNDFNNFFKNWKADDIDSSNSNDNPLRIKNSYWTVEPMGRDSDLTSSALGVHIIVIFNDFMNIFIRIYKL